MGIRPAHCYRENDKPAYSRIAIKVHKRNYIGATPGRKIRQFNMGNPLKDFKWLANICAERTMQIRDNSMESTRTAMNHYLTKTLGKENYFIKIRVYPFQILRENKQAQGAGADRVTKGMAHPFGKPIGRAIRVRKGQVLMSILIADDAGIKAVREGMLKIKSKLPCKISMDLRTDTGSIGTKPKRTRDEAAEKPKEEEAKAEETEKAGEAKPDAKAGAKGEAKAAGAKEDKGAKKETAKKK